MQDKTKIFDSVEDCIADFAEGKVVIVADDEGRENEGDLICAGEKITPEIINMMVTHARGLVCVPTTSERLAQLGIDDMVRLNRDSKGTAFTVTVDAAKGITTGISAADRALTVRIMSDPKCGPSDLVSPGHISPLRARPGGVLERAGHTEAAVDLASIAGLYPCAAICEVMNEDGSMARIPDLVKFKQKHGLKMMSVASLIEYRIKRDELVKKIFERPFKTHFGDFALTGFRFQDGRVSYALVRGEISEEPTLARVHSENVFADLFCAAEYSSASRAFEGALKYIAQEGRGALIYISQPDSGVKVPEGEPIRPNMRDYGLGAQVLKALGFKKIKLLTTHIGQHAIPEGFGLAIEEEINIPL